MANPWDFSGVKVDGFIFDSVLEGYVGSGKYTLTASGKRVTKENIESIDWEHPTIENLSLYQACQLPQDYAYIFDDADYCLAQDKWTVKVHISRQLFGDVTQYQNQISNLNTTIAEKDATIDEKNTSLNTVNSQLSEANAQIAAKDSEIEELNAALAEADELAIALFEAQQNASTETENPSVDTPVDEANDQVTEPAVDTTTDETV